MKLIVDRIPTDGTAVVVVVVGIRGSIAEPICLFEQVWAD